MSHMMSRGSRDSDHFVGLPPSSPAGWFVHDSSSVPPSCVLVFLTPDNVPIPRHLGHQNLWEKRTNFQVCCSGALLHPSFPVPVQLFLFYPPTHTHPPRKTKNAARVPLMIRAPWMPQSQGKRTEAIVELVDVYQTVCDLLDVPLPTVRNPCLPFPSVSSLSPYDLIGRARPTRLRGRRCARCWRIPRTMTSRMWR